MGGRPENRRERSEHRLAVVWRFPLRLGFYNGIYNNGYIEVRDNLCVGLRQFMRGVCDNLCVDNFLRSQGFTPDGSGTSLRENRTRPITGLDLAVQSAPIGKAFSHAASMAGG